MATQDTATEKCRPARTEITIDSSDKQNSENGSDVRVKPARLFSTTAASFRGVWWQSDSSTAELDERFIKGRDAGFSVDIVKDYVATLTDRSV